MVRRWCTASAAGGAASTDVSIEFYIGTEIEALDLAGRAGDGHVAHVDFEVGLGEELAVARHPGLAYDLATVGDYVGHDLARDVAAVDVQLCDAALHSLDISERAARDFTPVPKVSTCVVVMLSTLSKFHTDPSVFKTAVAASACGESATAFTSPT